MTSTVYFCTNRVLSGPADQLASYTNQPQTQTDPTGLVFGTAYVDGADLIDNTSWQVRSIQDVGTGDFMPGPKGDLADAGRNLLVFLHGFDNSLSDALTRAAFNQAWLSAGDPAADATVIAFAWPSLGKLIDFPILQGDYLRDQNVARWSGFHAMSFLRRLQPALQATRAAGGRCYLLAHSMGNLVLTQAVESWFLHGNGAASLFDAAFLAAGDCVASAFAQPAPAQLSNLTDLADRVAILYSHADGVLQLSQAVNLGAARLGQDGPLHRADPALFPPSRYSLFDATRLADYPVNPLSSHQYYRRSPSARSWIVGQMS